MKDKRFLQWHGIERTEIDWYPKLDKSKCIGCGLCVTTCGKGVYSYDFDEMKSEVVNPFNCMVACQTCSNLCPTSAIHFAENNDTREKVQEIIKKFKILPKVENELYKKKRELIEKEKEKQTET